MVAASPPGEEMPFFLLFHVWKWMWISWVDVVILVVTQRDPKKINIVV